jgi:hypothetical protein
MEMNLLSLCALISACLSLHLQFNEPLKGFKRKQKAAVPRRYLSALISGCPVNQK